MLSKQSLQSTNVIICFEIDLWFAKKGMLLKSWKLCLHFTQQNMNNFLDGSQKHSGSQGSSRESALPSASVQL